MQAGSPPVRRRGLKLEFFGCPFSCCIVASRAEAWIETMEAANNAYLSAVASRAEAWIETLKLLSQSLTSAGRLPCGGVD